MKKKYFAYIRVSTAKQGKQGVSLAEQRDAITRYAERSKIEIADWFEERETAAKRGRPVFGRMLELLKKGGIAGVVIHKIDRSARNLRDWAALGELIDEGVEIHFANESLDLHSRGGRLSADIQAVVAADYIRNLREEAKKGMYGRLKQGLYPLPAPLGYLDRGGGKVKELDPVRAPLVRRLFERYATRRYSLDDLVHEAWRIGLRNRRGGRVTKTGLSVILNNPFYIGIMRLRSTGETFPGKHEPLITSALFKRVGDVLQGKTNRKVVRHAFLFRRLLTCDLCGYTLTGERQKGHVYYRCHTKACPTRTIREEELERAVRAVLQPLRLKAEELTYLHTRIAELRASWKTEQASAAASLRLRSRQVEQRLDALVDAYLDGTLEKDLFERRKSKLLTEQQEIADQLQEGEAGKGSDVAERLQEFFELAGNVNLRYEMGDPDEKRELLRITTSNRVVADKQPVFTLKEPFRTIAERPTSSNSPPYRDRLRTLDRVLQEVVKRLVADQRLSLR